MATLGIELCDAGLGAVRLEQGQMKEVGGMTWPGFAYFDGKAYQFGQAAEDQWFVHPRRVAHTFWARLAHEPSTLGPAGRPAPFSELAFNFFREFQRDFARAGPAERIVLAVPGAYLRDPATEEERIGLLLGIAGELRLPLAGITDMACAALCDPRGHGFNPALPVVVLDLHLEGAEITLVDTTERLERREFLLLPQAGYAQLLKHLTATMGNRFLRQTAFDILEDGRIEQLFFQQTKQFLASGAADHRYQINTASRTYELLAKREQLAADAQAFVQQLVQSVEGFRQRCPELAAPFILALTHRAAQLPGLETRLHAAGFPRILRLPALAAAAGAAQLGDSRSRLPTDLADVPVETALPLSLARRFAPAPWEARLAKARQPGRGAPTHAILDGRGLPLGGRTRFTIGVAGLDAELVLPDTFNTAEDCAVTLVREEGTWWLVDPLLPRSPGVAAAPAPRTPVEAGDRLVVRSGQATAEILFAACPPA
jgi:hypothetical protein